MKEFSTQQIKQALEEFFADSSSDTIDTVSNLEFEQDALSALETADLIKSSIVIDRVESPRYSNTAELIEKQKRDVEGKAEVIISAPVEPEAALEAPELPSPVATSSSRGRLRNLVGVPIAVLVLAALTVSPKPTLETFQTKYSCEGGHQSLAFGHFVIPQYHDIEMQIREKGSNQTISLGRYPSLLMEDNKYVPIMPSFKLQLDDRGVLLPSDKAFQVTAIDSQLKAPVAQSRFLSICS